MPPRTRNHSPAAGNSTNNSDDAAAAAAGAGAGDVKLRRAHRKSRNGCKECKRRHVKCDETRPTCVNCATAERHCSYLDSLPITTRSVVPAKRARAADGGSVVSPATNGVPTPGLANVDSAGSPSITTVVNDFVLRAGENNEVLRPANGQFFTLDHMHLFRHLHTEMPIFISVEQFQKPMMDMAIEAALGAPYLMDILLAHSALHMEEAESSRADFWRHQATQLQTRGLMLFNEAKEELSDENCIPMFLFTSFVGGQLLCDTLRNYRDDFNGFLDQFAWYLTLHRGVNAVTARNWHTIRDSKAKDYIQFLESRHPVAAVPELEVVNSMLDQADLRPASLEACRAATRALRDSYGIYRSLSGVGSHQSSSVMSFGVHVTTGFIDVLKQRRPEALVILAYYGVLLHWSRDFWMFRDAGQYLIRSISAHLGDYWSEWLAFPNSVLEGEHAG